jgi:hypothetical protein
MYGWQSVGDHSGDAFRPKIPSTLAHAYATAPSTEIWFCLIVFGYTPGSHTYILYPGSILLYLNGGLKRLRSQHSVFSLQTRHTHSSLELAALWTAVSTVCSTSSLRLLELLSRQKILPARCTPGADEASITEF